jgi:exopolysaccharide biosynthesis polyprenyl glycosylphosphotransferase
MAEDLDLAVERGSAARIYRRIGLGLAVTDGLCLAIALTVSYLVRFGFQPLPFDWLVTAVLSPFIWIAIFFGFRLHSPQHLSNWEEFSRTISASSLGVVVVALMSYWSKASFSRAWVGLTWLSVVILELAARRGWRWNIARLRQAGRLNFRTLIVGATPESGQLARDLRASNSGYLPVGCVSVDNESPVEGGVPIVGTLEELTAAVSASQADCLFVAPGALDMDAMARVAQVGRRAGAEVRVAANLPEVLAPRLTIQAMGSFMALSLRPVKLTGIQAVAKRIFDLALSVPGALLIVPIAALIAVAIKVESRGPVFFIQERVTKNGETFRMLKFRTMYQDADRLIDDAGIDLSRPFFKLEDDPRLTRVGRFLRRSSLDELPQLWNVFMGKMSLVGPRPLPVDQVRANEELLSPRLEVHAGITGWWQVQGRSDLDLHESLKLDVFYIENWSLGLDLYILLKTIGAVLRKRGAY